MGSMDAGRPDDDTPVSLALETPEEVEAPPPIPDAPEAAARVSLTQVEKLVAAASVVAGALLTMLVLLTRVGVSASSPTDAVPPPQPAAAVATAAASSATLEWTDANRDEWVDSRRAVAYEVPADRTVNAWMRTVRPALVVRCEGNALDVFVFTDSAAQMERDTPDHTVRVQFDDGDEESARWQDADRHDALFAPDGAHFARRIAQARTLRFGFTPHNAEAVTVRFQVAGLEPLLARAAKDGCKGAVK